MKMNSNAILLVNELFGGIQINPAPSTRVASAEVREIRSKAPTDFSREVTTFTISKEVLRVVGPAALNAANCRQVRKQVCAALNGHSVIEVDLSQTEFIDCAGLGALVAVRNQTRGGKGVVRLLNPTASVQQLLDFMRAGRVFEIVHSEDDGCELATELQS
jgi:anti-anti-sigma factor